MENGTEEKCQVRGTNLIFIYASAHVLFSVGCTCAGSPDPWGFLLSQARETLQGQAVSDPSLAQRPTEIAQKIKVWDVTIESGMDNK